MSTLNILWIWKQFSLSEFLRWGIIHWFIQNGVYFIVMTKFHLLYPLVFFRCMSELAIWELQTRHFFQSMGIDCFHGAVHADSWYWLIFFFFCVCCLCHFSFSHWTSQPFVSTGFKSVDQKFSTSNNPPKKVSLLSLIPGLSSTGLHSMETVLIITEY